MSQYVLIDELRMLIRNALFSTGGRKCLQQSLDVKLHILDGNIRQISKEQMENNICLRRLMICLTCC